GGAEGPAAPQHQIVEILEPDAGGLAEDIHLIQQFLQIHHLHFPRTRLAADHFAQCIGGAAMAAAGIEKDKFESLSAARDASHERDKCCKPRKKSYRDCVKVQYSEERSEFRSGVIRKPITRY